MKRSFLTALGLEKEVINQIMDEHGISIELAKDKTRELSDTKVGKLEKENLSLQEKIDNLPNSDGEDWKTKYETQKSEFDTYKQKTELKNTLTSKKTAVKQQLESENANPKVIKLLMKDIDFENVELDGEKVKDWETVVKPLKNEYPDFFGEIKEQGEREVNPPKSSNGEITKEKFIKMGYNERNELYQENKDLYDKLKGE